MKRLFIISAIIAGIACVSAQAEDAKATFEKQCAKCHGPDGKGDTKMGKKLGIKDYSDAKVQAAVKDEAVLKAMKDGVKDKDGKIQMKPVEGLTDDDVKGLAKYFRTLKK